MVILWVGRSLVSCSTALRPFILTGVCSFAEKISIASNGAVPAQKIRFRFAWKGQPKSLIFFLIIIRITNYYKVLEYSVYWKLKSARKV